MYLEHRGFLDVVVLVKLPPVLRLQHISTDRLIVRITSRLRILGGAGLLIKLVSSNDLHLKSFL